MKSEATLYEDLEVSPHASAMVIKAAYRCLAQINHPDRNSGSAACSERLAQINHAYSVLADPVKRRRYDLAVELQQHGIDRRGHGANAGAGCKPMGNHSQTLRAFVFRPFA